MHRFFISAIAVLLSTAVAAQEETSARSVIQSGGRVVTFTDAVPKEHTGYDSPWHYAHAIRAGDFVYISGIVVGAAPDDAVPISRERFQEYTEQAFEIIERYLETAGATPAGLVKINTFHVLDGKAIELAIDEQALVIAEVKAKYAVEPHPAWTAVGTTGLFSPRGIVEIEIVVYAPLGDEGA